MTLVRAALCSIFFTTGMLNAGLLHASDSAVSDQCRIGDWDMQAEQHLFQTAPRSVGAARQVSDPRAELAPGQLWAVTLLGETEVRLVAAVHRRPLPRVSFAGLAAVTVPMTGRYRITIDGPAWIEIVHDDHALPTTRFGSQRACPLFRKSVEFELAAGLSHVLQFSHAASAVLRVTIVPSGGSDAVRRASQAH